MSLTTTDLANITTIIKAELNESESRLASKADLSALESRLESRLTTKMEHMELRLTTKMDRMESRLVTAIDLLQRDAYERLDNHETRLSRLEHAHD